MRRLKFGSPDTCGSKFLLADEAVAVVDAWQDGWAELPEDFEEQVDWEAKWMDAAMSRGALEIPRVRPVAPAPPVIPEAPGTPSIVPGAVPSTQPTQSTQAVAPVSVEVPAGSTKRQRFCWSPDRSHRSVPMSGHSASSSSASLSAPSAAVASSSAFPGKRGPGRPPVRSSDATAAAPAEPPAKRGPGRPRKDNSTTIAAAPRGVGRPAGQTEADPEALAAVRHHLGVGAGPGPSDAPVGVKQAKNQKGELTRSEKAREIEALKQQLQEAEAEMESMATDPKVETGDDAFHVLVQEFADDSKANPFAIEDSPEQPRAKAERTSGAATPVHAPIDIDSDRCTLVLGDVHIGSSLCVGSMGVAQRVTNAAGSTGLLSGVGTLEPTTNSGLDFFVLQIDHRQLD